MPGTRRSNRSSNSNKTTDAHTADGGESPTGVGGEGEEEGGGRGKPARAEGSGCGVKAER